MNCKIKSITIQTNLHNNSLYNHINSLEEFEAQIKSGNCPSDTVTTYSDGTISTKNGCTYIKYADEESLQTDKTTTTISFKNDTPNEIFISRRGAIKSDLVFIKGKPCQSIFYSPLIKFEYLMNTKEIKNKLFSENYLEIIYYIQIKGAEVEKTFLRIEVEQND